MTDNDFDLYEIAEPRPSGMIESLRAVGYSLPTAIADLVDNSISANARNIWITFEWNGGSSFVRLVDDGHGMNTEELVVGMTLGGKSPLEPRDSADLGRFGLGLKTASFSQCRRLSVSSKKQGLPTVFRCWDLDYVSRCGEWRLLKEPESTALEQQEPLNKLKSGTVVLWEQLDRLVASNTAADDKKSHKRFFEAVTEVERHLGMVFHRFLERRNRIHIWINENEIDPWDPFLQGETATQNLPEETIQLQSGVIKVFPFVLPHHSKIDDDTFKKASGLAGWNGQQGFYVYRNERLLVPGHWLGFGFQKEEHYKLARIQIDIPSSMDAEWTIDVKKSRARPPALARESLRRIARLTRDIASGIYRNRGKIVVRTISQDFIFTWLRAIKEGKISYRINRDHPIVVAALSCSSEKATTNALLRLIEETLPKEQIWLDNQESVESRTDPFEGLDRKEISAVLKELYTFLKSTGLSNAEVRERLASMEPFNHFPSLVNSVCDR